MRSLARTLLLIAALAAVGYAFQRRHWHEAWLMSKDILSLTHCLVAVGFGDPEGFRGLFPRPDQHAELEGFENAIARLIQQPNVLYAPRELPRLRDRWNRSYLLVYYSTNRVAVQEGERGYALRVYSRGRNGKDEAGKGDDISGTDAVFVLPEASRPQ